MISAKTPRVKLGRRTPTTPTPKLWDPPPFPATGDVDERLTFEAVGRALSQWEHFEAYFGLIFGAFVGANDQTDAAIRAYGTIVTFKGRCDMLRAASEAHFLEYPDATLQPQFDKIIKTADGFSGRRNEIAHGIVQPYFPDGRSRSGTALVPSYHATSKRRLTAGQGSTPHHVELKYAYSSVELENFRVAFEALTKTAIDFYRPLTSVMRK